MERDVKRDQGPVNATDSLATPSCVLLSFGRAFGSAVQRYNLSLSTQSKLTKLIANTSFAQWNRTKNRTINRTIRTTPFQFSHSSRFLRTTPQMKRFKPQCSALQEFISLYTLVCTPSNGLLFPSHCIFSLQWSPPLSKLSGT
jgi:hypothetical protein